MTRYLVGAGGWSYFKIPGGDPLKWYSEVFDFVEVNSTFYRIIPLEIVSSWRKRVPPKFEFSVRLHRSASHKNFLEPVEETFRMFDYAEEVCDILRSETIVVETPETIEYTPKKIRSLKDLFGSIGHRGKRFAWEVRTKKAELPHLLVHLMEEYRIVPITDLSKSEPPFVCDQIYSRLFGKGIHNIYQFTDKELQEIDHRTKRHYCKKVSLSFHGIKMYKDAARYVAYLKTGRLPSVTGHTGLASLKAIL
ncbi:MAG: DUF72 domain-containing protein [Nitrososphaeria archaeon]